VARSKRDTAVLAGQIRHQINAVEQTGRGGGSSAADWIKDMVFHSSRFRFQNPQIILCEQW